MTQHIFSFLRFSTQSPGWQLAFRPFFLFGSLWGALVILYWALAFNGYLPVLSHLGPIHFHTHEMIFGFSAAIIVGFLFTASQNWTGQRGVHGRKLQLLFLSWLVGRMASLTSLWHVALAADFIFLSSSAIFLFHFLRMKEQNRNKIFPLILGFFVFFDIILHIPHFVADLITARSSYLFSLGLVMLVITIMGGRVIPFFTQRGVAGATPRRVMPLEILVISTTFFVFSFELFHFQGPVASVIAFTSAIAHFTRWILWQPWKSRTTPILWILHISYLWFVPGMIFKGLHFLQVLPETFAIHSFTVGVLSSIVLGMISRVSLGHTGRPLKAAHTMVVAYLMIQSAAFVRVFTPLIWPVHTSSSYIISGGLWFCAFMIFVLTYAEALLSPRADGRAG